MANFTPGPWKHIPCGVRFAVVPEFKADSGDVCRAQREDNARLIAAAPELLEALKDCMYEIRDSNSIKKHALLIIAKAEGKKTG